MATDALPTASDDRAVVYVIGPGFGESQVVLLPGNFCIVVDSCTHQGANLTRSLLEALAVDQIDLLVVTHPDLDHIRGMDEVITTFPPRRIWRYPSATVRDLVAHWCRLDPTNQRLAELAKALDALDAFETRGLAYEVGFRTRPLQLFPEVEIHVIAPTQCDQTHERARLRRILRAGDDGVEVAAPLRGYLEGARGLGDHPNTISLAISVCFRGQRILIAGDVENGRPAQKASGWKGVLMHLREDDLTHLVEDVKVVKVAHHGSSGAFYANAWRLHARADQSTVAVIAPFSKGTSLPSRDVLSNLRSFVRRVSITSDAGSSFARAVAAGWTGELGEPLAALGPHVAVVVVDEGSRVLTGGEASSFVSVGEAPS